MNPSFPSVTIWDEKHAKALLGLRRNPLRLIQVEPWQSWIAQRGGLNQVRQTLRTYPLQSEQSKLLNLLIEHPNASTIFYAGKLNISHSHYFIWLNDLLKTLLSELNNWKIEPPQQHFYETAHLTNLPSPLTSLIGAEESVLGVVAMLQRPGVRLLTLTGPGGVGKTRMAMAAGARLLNEFRDGIFFISLETLNDPAFLNTQIAHSLNIETAGMQSLTDALKMYLRNRHILLILDNFEQLIQGGSLITELLEAAAELKVLVTSREALNLYGENRFNVPELTRPDPNDLPPLEQLNAWPAIDLFTQRVQARYPSFSLTESNKEIVVDICNRVDGLPLAIELAAAQVKLFAPDQTLPHLERSLKSLRDPARNRLTRQKTLWDAFDWSYRLLSESEQVLFRRLAVFGREWSMDAAQVICETDDALGNLEKLADKSLVRFVSVGVDGRLRCQMLQAVREYALEKLSSNTETGPTQRSHAHYYLEMVLQAEPLIGTPNQLQWMRQIEQERENLQIALQWMLDSGEVEMAYSLLGAVWRFYHMLNIWSETRLWMERALAQGTHLKSAGRVKALWGAYWLAVYRGDHSQSLALVDEGLSIAKEIGDQRLVGLLLQSLADEFCHRNQYDEAFHTLQESLLIFRELNDQEETAWTLGHISGLFARRGDLVKGQEILQESLGIFRAIGHDWATALVLRNLAFLFLQHDDLTQAKIALEESLLLSMKMGDRMGIGWVLNLQGRLALRQSELESARKLFEEAQAIFEKFGDEGAFSFNQDCINQMLQAERAD